MTLNSNNHAETEGVDELESWKGICRDLQHFSRDIETLTAKIQACFLGDETVTVTVIQVDCRNYLTAANQRQAAMRRIIDQSRSNPHYSLRQVVVFEKKAGDLIAAAYSAWLAMLGWVPAMPVSTSACAG